MAPQIILDSLESLTPKVTKILAQGGYTTKPSLRENAMDYAANKIDWSYPPAKAKKDISQLDADQKEVLSFLTQIENPAIAFGHDEGKFSACANVATWPPYDYFQPGESLQPLIGEKIRRDAVDIAKRKGVSGSDDTELLINYVIQKMTLPEQWFKGDLSYCDKTDRIEGVWSLYSGTYPVEVEVKRQMTVLQALNEMGEITKGKYYYEATGRLKERFEEIAALLGADGQEANNALYALAASIVPFRYSPEKDTYSTPYNYNAAYASTRLARELFIILLDKGDIEISGEVKSGSELHNILASKAMNPEVPVLTSLEVGKYDGLLHAMLDKQHTTTH
jgi:hypothetical protein